MHGLYLLWWVQERQTPPAIVATILAAGDLAIMGLEIPTGWFADRFGHRVSLIVGSSVQVAGMLACWLGAGIPGLLSASVLVALGDSFRSGADQALLYRTCLVLDREDAFQKTEARTNAVELGALVGLVLAGGVIVERWGFAAGWMVETALCACGVAIACAMVEPPPAVSDTVSSGPENHARVAVGTMAMLIIPAAFLGAAASAASFLAQTAGATDPMRITTLVATITLTEAAGSACAARVTNAGLRAQVILAACGVVLVGGALALPAAFQLVVLALAFLVGLAHPLRATAIQRLASDDVRARAASAANACDMAFSTIALPLAGLWRNR
jgi:hypothetical protein